MPRCPDLRRSGRLPSDRGEDGFTLVEVLVAFLIIAIIATAGTSLTIRGLRATLDAKQLSQAKNLLNEQVEQMRGLPYFVANTTSTSVVDVLDRYYPSTSPDAGAPNCMADAATWLANSSWAGYVAAGNTARCSFEPATGAFYRTILDPALSGSGQTAIVVATQFLGLANGDGSQAPPVNPLAGYAWNATGQDNPVTSQIAAYATAVYGPPGAGAKRTTTRTDIADRRGGPPLVSAETNAAAVVVDGTLATGAPQRLEIGSVAGNGAVTVVTKAAVEAVGGSLQTDAGRLDGAAQLASSPGTVSGSSTGGVLTSGGLSIGPTHTSGVSATSTVSDPGYGGPAVASASSGSFSLDQAWPDLGLSASDPIVTVDAGATTASLPGGGACPAAAGSYGAAGAGWMNTGIASPLTLAACAQSEAATVELFPIAGTAPDGLLQVVASDVVARCAVSGSTPTAGTSGAVTVRWLTASPATYAETTVTLNGTTVTGALPDVTEALANGKTIADYVDSWAAFSGVERDETFDTSTNTRTATAHVPAALTLSTVPLRTLSDGTPDPDGAARVTVGRALCSATDRR